MLPKERLLPMIGVCQSGRRVEERRSSGPDPDPRAAAADNPGISFCSIVAPIQAQDKGDEPTYLIQPATMSSSSCEGLSELSDQAIRLVLAYCSDDEPSQRIKVT
jgi:hypothetical protein